MRRKREESGAALVEFALLLPVFMALILGMFSGGIAYNQKLDLTHATREGARYGATVAVTNQFANGQNWASNVRAAAILYPGLERVMAIEQPTDVVAALIAHISLGRPVHIGFLCDSSDRQPCLFHLCCCVVRNPDQDRP